MDRQSATAAQLIPVFAINLSRAQARRALMAEQAQQAGVSIAFVDAVDSRSEAGRAAVDALPDFGPWGVFHGHDRACTLSHLKALRAFVESGASHGLILEDDVFLAHDLGEWLAETAWWPAQADLVKFERWRDDRLLVALSKESATVKGRALHVLHSRHSGGAAYALTREAAQTILAAPAPTVPIDHLLFSPNVSQLARAFKTYQVSPALVVQGNEPPREPDAAPQDRGVIPENAVVKTLLRGWQEAKVFPKLLVLYLTGRITLENVAFASEGAQQ